jgi:hypothetical protein
MSAFFQSELVRRLRESGLFTRVVNLTETPWQPSAEKALRLDGRITRLGEGSQAARAFLGLYWAGEARAQSDMTITDIQTEQPVIVTADRRVAQMGFFGGDSKDHLKESFDDMARDLARFLVRLSRGRGAQEGVTPGYWMLTCASVVCPVRPLMGRISCGHAEKAITRSISARSTT